MKYEDAISLSGWPLLNSNQQAASGQAAVESCGGQILDLAGRSIGPKREMRDMETMKRSKRLQVFVKNWGRARVTISLWPF